MLRRQASTRMWRAALLVFAAALACILASVGDVALVDAARSLRLPGTPFGLAFDAALFATFTLVAVASLLVVRGWERVGPPGSLLSRIAFALLLPAAAMALLGWKASPIPQAGRALAIATVCCVLLAALLGWRRSFRTGALWPFVLLFALATLGGGLLAVEADEFRRPLRLAHADLQFGSLRLTDLQDAQLQFADLRGIEANDLDLGGADLRGATLAGAKIRGKLRAVGAVLRDVDLTGASFDTLFAAGADATRIALDGASGRIVAPFATLDDCSAQGAQLHGSEFGGADLRRCNLRCVAAAEARLTGADLSGANLQDADLPFARAQFARMRGADLRWARFESAAMTGADLSGAALRGTSFRSARLDYATLDNDDMEKAHWEGAEPCRPRLPGARAEFPAAALKGALCRSADASGCTLFDARGSQPDWTEAGFRELANALVETACAEKKDGPYAGRKLLHALRPELRSALDDELPRLPRGRVCLSD